MNLYRFRQNNSGGSWDLNEWTTITMVIEAETGEAANRIAEQETSIYYNGCSKGMDCSCCGDRWDETYTGRSGEEFDKIDDFEKFLKHDIKYNKEWINEDYHDKITVVIVFFRDGLTNKYYATGRVEHLSYEESAKARNRMQRDMFL